MTPLLTKLRRDNHPLLPGVLARLGLRPGDMLDYTSGEPRLLSEAEKRELLAGVEKLGLARIEVRLDHAENLPCGAERK